MRVEGQFQWRQESFITRSEVTKTRTERLGLWVIVSLCFAIVIHLALFIALGHVPFGIGWAHQQDEIVTDRVVVRQVEDDSWLPATEKPLPETPAKPDLKNELEDLDVLTQLKEPELEMKPDVKSAAFNIDLSDVPAAAGDPLGTITSKPSTLDLAALESTSLGKMDVPLPLNHASPVIVDPGGNAAKPDEIDAFVQNLMRLGNHGKAIQGLPDGQTSLDDMIGLPANVLVNRTTLLPSDLLFEYNQSQLRDSAKVGLQKIALIMDRNPELFCWIDGHSDLFGGDAFNDELSQRRAEAVKQYLVSSMGMDGNKIITRGLGKRAAIVTEGDVQQQSVNRRVEIKMRKTPPRAVDFPVSSNNPAPRATTVDSLPAQATAVPAEAITPQPSAPPSAMPVAEPTTSPAPKAMLLKPNQPPLAIPVNPAPVPPRAQVIPDPGTPPPPAAKAVAPHVIDPE